MKPTYSVSEIRSFISSFDIPELEVLTGLVNEEASLYLSAEVKEIYSLIAIARKERTSNEVQLEFLLSFN
jgi:hypothetical protein